MKKTIFFVIVMIFTMSSTIAFAADRKSNSVATENKLSEVELNRLTNRAEEIRDMDKTTMTVKENRELKKEARDIDKNVAKSGGTVYIGAGALILIILLIVLLV
jgi:peptidoglycan hydrolase CwlO-like protein